MSLPLVVHCEGLPPTQVLLMAKHPAERLMPLANVDDAEVDVISSALDWMPPAKVLVAVVVATKRAATTSPTTESLAYGEVVPSPKFPASVRRNFSSLFVAQAKYSLDRAAEISALKVAWPSATSRRKSVPDVSLSLRERIGAVCWMRRSRAVSVVPSKVRSASEVIAEADDQYAMRFAVP